MSITIFTSLKSMEDTHIATIQRNAIQSWQAIQQPPEIFIFGDKPGVKELADELGIRHFAKVPTSDNGLEKVNTIFNRAWKYAIYDTLCYVNGDMILPPYFNEVIDAINCENYLLVGQRQNTPIIDAIDFSLGWWQKIRDQAQATGHRHTVNGIDYFVHRRNAFRPLPELFLGSWYWDNVLLGISRNMGIPIIDATDAIFAIHQGHDYNHYEGGLTGVSEGPESVSNRSKAMNGILLSIADADYHLIPAYK